jgi:DNA-binding MarR family transcriptional regulator
MTATSDDLQTASRFLDVVPTILHGLRGGFQGFEPEGMHVTLAQLRCLAALEAGPRTLGALAGQHDVAPPTMSRLVTTLVERGWVERKTDPADRRQAMLSVSPAGAAIRRAMSRRLAELLAERLAELPADERSALDRALDGLARIETARRVRAGGEA